MKNNKGLTLIELIVVVASLGIVITIVGFMLNSSLKDTNTITEKVYVQNTVTELINIVQKDIQEAKIIAKKVDNNTGENVEITEGILLVEDNNYYFNKMIRDEKLKEGEVRYIFNSTDRIVTREEGIGSEEVLKETFKNIQLFELKEIIDENYGVDVEIVGSKYPDTYKGTDKTRYALHSRFYTRNTIR